jgi:hypothetical protein
MQLEVGSFPTSYIKTTGSQVTRSVDSAVMNNIDTSEWFKQGQGTILFNGKQNGTGNNGLIKLNDGTNNNVIGLYVYASSNTMFAHIEKDGTIYSDLNLSATSSGADYKAILSYDYNNVNAIKTGTSVVTDTGSIIPFVTTLDLYRYITTSATTGAKYIKKLAYYPLALTSNEITDLSEE